MLSWYRAGAVACAKHRTTHGNTEITVTIVAEDTVGSRSLLVRASSVYGTTLHAFVVTGDLFTEFMVSNDDAQLARALMQRAYQNLCGVAKTC